MSKLDMSKGAVPLYLQISTRLRDKIIKKEYGHGELIPSEADLQKQYDVSRITARQAIQELEKEGLVSRARGVGTVVTYQKTIEEFLTRIVSFTEEMKEKQIVPGTKTASIEIIKSTPELSDIFGVRDDTPLYHILRVRTGDGVPLVIFETYLGMEHNLPLDHSLYYDSLYALLEEHGASPVRIKEKFDCLMPNENQKEELEITDDQTPILRRSRISYDYKGDVLEYTISYYRADRYTYSIEIKK